VLKLRRLPGVQVRQLTAPNTKIIAAGCRRHFNGGYFDPARGPGSEIRYMLTTAISDARDWMAVRTKVLHSASPLIPNLSDKKTQWRASLFPRGQRMPHKFLILKSGWTLFVRM
jgi:hypothetical protein